MKKCLGIKKGMIMTNLLNFYKGFLYSNFLCSANLCFWFLRRFCIFYNLVVIFLFSFLGKDFDTFHMSSFVAFLCCFLPMSFWSSNISQFLFKGATLLDVDARERKSGGRECWLIDCCCEAFSLLNGKSLHQN